VRSLRQGFARIVAPTLHQLQGLNGNTKNLEYSQHFRLTASVVGGDGDHAIGNDGYSVWLSPSNHIGNPRGLDWSAGNVGGEQGHPHLNYDGVEHTFSVVTTAYAGVFASGQPVAAFRCFYAQKVEVDCGNGAGFQQVLGGARMACWYGFGEPDGCGTCAGDLTLTGGSYSGAGAGGGVSQCAGGDDMLAYRTWSQGGPPPAYGATPNDCMDAISQRGNPAGFTGYGYYLPTGMSTRQVTDGSIYAYDWTGSYTGEVVAALGAETNLLPVVFADASADRSLWVGADSPAGGMGATALSTRGPIAYVAPNWVDVASLSIYVYSINTCTMVPLTDPPTTGTTGKFTEVNSIYTPLVQASYALTSAGKVVSIHSNTTGLTGVTVIEAPSGSPCMPETRNFICAGLGGFNVGQTTGICGITLPPPCALSYHVSTPEEPYEYSWYADLPKNLANPPYVTADGVRYGEVTILDANGQLVRAYASGTYENKSKEYRTVEYGVVYIGYVGVAYPMDAPMKVTNVVADAEPIMMAVDQLTMEPGMCEICIRGYISESVTTDNRIMALDVALDAYALEIAEATIGDDYELNYSGGTVRKYNSKYDAPVSLSFHLNYVVNGKSIKSSTISLPNNTLKIPLALPESYSVLNNPPAQIPPVLGPRVFGQLPIVLTSLEFTNIDVPLTRVSSGTYRSMAPLSLAEHVLCDIGGTALPPQPPVTTTRTVRLIKKRV